MNFLTFCSFELSRPIELIILNLTYVLTSIWPFHYTTPTHHSLIPFAWKGHSVNILYHSWAMSNTIKIWTTVLRPIWEILWASAWSLVFKLPCEYSPVFPFHRATRAKFILHHLSLVFVSVWPCVRTQSMGFVISPLPIVGRPIIPFDQPTSITDSTHPLSSVFWTVIIFHCSTIYSRFWTTHLLVLEHLVLDRSKVSGLYW